MKQNIISNLISPGYEKFKCYDLLINLYNTNTSFKNVIDEGYSKGFIKPFSYLTWDFITNYNNDFVGAFEKGLNIGSCFSFANMLSYSYDRAYFCSGFNKYLVGTKNSKNGEHHFINNGGIVIDTSLMIEVDDCYLGQLGYEILFSKAVDSIANYDLYQKMYIKSPLNKM